MVQGTAFNPNNMDNEQDTLAFMAFPDISEEQIDPASTLNTNLVSKLSKEEQNEVANRIVEGYKADEDSRAKWKERYNTWSRLFYVRPEYDKKNEPWSNAANIVLPILNIACNQFWARAVDALYSSKEIIKVVPIGMSEEDQKKAERVSKYMNYQIHKLIPNYFKSMDKTLMQLPVAGTVIRKTYWDSNLKKVVSDFISPENFVVNYNTRYLDNCYRKTHILSETLNDMRIKESEKIYENVDEIVAKNKGVTISDLNSSDTREINEQTQDMIQNSDNNTGIQANQQDDFQYRPVLEQHTYLQLKDSDKEMVPYIAFVDLNSKTLLRLIKNEDFSIIGESEEERKRPYNYFTKYGMIPAPDDSFYDVGFGTLLERINESANTIINQLIDAGTLANTQSGFINKSSNLKRGQLRLKRGEFIETDMRTDDIRKALMPFTFKEPSFVLFNLLGMLQEQANRVTTVSEMFTGEMPSSDTSATAVVRLIEQGLKVFSAIYRGLHISAASEYQKIYDLNGLYLDERAYLNIVVNEDAIAELGVSPEIIQLEINKEDFRSKLDVRPVSDPAIISRTERVAIAQMLYQTSLSNPLVVNNPISLYGATENFYRAVEDNDFIVKKILGPIEEQIRLQIQAQQQQAQEQAIRQEALNIMEQQVVAGIVPEEIYAQFRTEQNLGQEILAEQAARQEVAQGRKATTQQRG